MATHTVRNFRRERYWGVRYDENDLARLASILQEFKEADESLEIKIAPFNADEEIRSRDPAFFASPDMPARLESVDYTLLGSIFASVELRRHYAELSVSGEDRKQVAAAFLVLSDEMKARRVPNWRLLGALAGQAGWIGTILVVLLAVAVSSLTVYSMFNLLFGYIPLLRGMRSWAIPAALGLQAPFAPMLSFAMFYNAFPAVQFAGRLSDSGTRLRSRLASMLVLIVIPVVVNLITQGLGR